MTCIPHHSPRGKTMEKTMQTVRGAVVRVNMQQAHLGGRYCTTRGVNASGSVKWLVGSTWVFSRTGAVNLGLDGQGLSAWLEDSKEGTWKMMGWWKWISSLNLPFRILSPKQRESQKKKTRYTSNLPCWQWLWCPNPSGKITVGGNFGTGPGLTNLSKHGSKVQ